MNSHLKKAIELQRSGDLNGAIAVLVNAEQAGIRNQQHYHFLSLLQDAVGSTESALESIGKAIASKDADPDCWYHQGNLLNKLQRCKEAIPAYRKCLSLKADHVHCLVNLSLVLQTEELWEDSLEYAEQAMRVAPAEMKAWLAYIGTLGFLRRFDDGCAACAEAVTVFGENAELLHMQGNILLASGRVDEAQMAYESALTLAPESIRILTSVGDFYAQYRNARDAIPYLEKALKLNPSHLDAKHRLGSAYLMAGFPADAVSILLPVIRENPRNADAFDGLILSSLYLDQADEGEIYNLHQQWAAYCAARFYPICTTATKPKPRGVCLKVGFLSPDFRNHSVSRFMTPLLRNIEGSDWEVVCYSDVKQQSAFTHELEAIGATWVYSYSMTDSVLAERIQSDGIDVLIDLAGHTGNNRMLLFARKPAPMQISWLGYPNTTGLETIDYRFSDRIADPEGRADALSTEPIVRLPNGFHCFEPPMLLPEVQSTPALSAGVVTFGSFNNQSKINQRTLESWAAVLRNVPQSRLLLKNHQLGDSRNQAHWLEAMERLGIDRSRVELIGFVTSLEAHYRTYEKVDIALDTFPYNGTTTTCEALWMGVPVLTIAGDTQRSRMGASLLTHAGYPEWVAADREEWVSIARSLSADLVKLNHIRLSLREKVEASPIGDQKAFAQKFWSVLHSLWRQQCRSTGMDSPLESE